MSNANRIYERAQNTKASLYNNEYIDFTKEPMFLGKGRNTQRFEVLKYEYFDKSNDTMQGFDWKHNEVSLVKDIKDFKGPMKKAEKFVVTRTFQKLIFLDSLQGRGPFLTLGQIATLPELENAILTWTYFEGAKHSRTYTEQLRCLYDNPTEIFDESWHIPELNKIADSISAPFERAYFNIIGHIYKTQRNIEMTQEEIDELYESIVMLVIEINTLEGIRFYSGFASVWALTEGQKYLPGTSENLMFICLHPETDVLTSEGWKKVEELSLDDNIAQYHMDSRNISFSKPSRKIWRQYDGKMYKITDSKGKVIQHITEDHEVVVNRKNVENETMLKCKVQDLKFAPNTYFPQGGKLISDNEAVVNTLDRFRIAVQADGSINKRLTGKRTGYNVVKFNLSKDQKITDLIAYCKELNFEITEKENYLTTRCFYVKVPVEYNISKNLDWISLDSNVNYIDELLLEMTKWDGSKSSKSSSDKYAIYTSEQSIHDKIVAMITLSSYKLFNYKQVNKKKESYKLSHRIYFREDEKVINTQNYNMEAYDYSGMIGCVTMPEGTIITKSVNDKICVTSNCRDENEHLALTQHIFKHMKRKTEEGFVDYVDRCKDKIIKRYIEVYNEELEWIDYKFSEGSYIGMNAKIAKDYLTHITIKRMKGVGINVTKEMLGGNWVIHNPIPWVNKYINMDSVERLPQEENVLNYITGGVTQDLDEDSEQEVASNLLKGLFNE